MKLSHQHHCRMQVTKTLNERITQYCQITLETMAYAGTGDVLKIQQMLAIAGEHIEVEEGEAWKVEQKLCSDLIKSSFWNL